MKKIPLLIALMLTLAACGPIRHAVHVEMKHPSKSGIDFTGKKIAVVYLENDNDIATSLSEGMASGLAYSMESDQGTGQGSVGTYMMRVTSGGDYASRDTLVNLILDTDSDVVFLIDTISTGLMTIGGATSVSSASSPDSSYFSSGQLPFTMKLYCFDAMNMDEKVYSFSGSSVAVPFAYSDGRQSAAVIRERALQSLPEVGFEVGMNVASTFRTQWKHEQYSILYFDTPSQWYDAMELADQYYWKEAMDIWLGLLDTNDLMRRACAAYNISVASYMLGDYDLAKEWLDRSDADNKLPLSDGMRKRIEARR